MKNDGKLLEQTFVLIQETFKNSELTKIFKNFRLENTSQNKREIDVLIVSQVNNFEIKIAIECKDYKDKIGVGQIEAFHSKCLRIPSINKKVFVSRKGYQKDAIDSANDFGIELLTADLVSKQTILSWLSIKQISLKIFPEITKAVLTINELSEKIRETTSSFSGLIYAYGKDEPIKLLEFIFRAVLENKKLIFKLSLIEWLRLTEKRKHKKFPVPFDLNFDNYYIKNNSGEKIRLIKVNSGVMVKFVESEAKIIEGRNVNGPNNEKIAKSIKVDMGKDFSTDIILKEKQDAHFYMTNSKGESIQLEKLLSYNPKTDKFS